MGDSVAIRTNQQLRRHALTVRLTLRADSTYSLLTTGPAETGTYSLRGPVLRARTSAGRPASFDGDLLTRLTRRALVWEQPIWGADYQVFRQLNYVRVK